MLRPDPILTQKGGDMKKLFIIFILLGILFFTFFGECFSEKKIPIGMAVFFGEKNTYRYGGGVYGPCCLCLYKSG